MRQTKIYERAELRGRTEVYQDRREAGRILGDLVQKNVQGEVLVMAVPAGGVPVGIEVAARVQAPLDVAVVSKITLPWNPEAGYGAVAFDGTVRLNEELLARLGLSSAEVEQGIAATKAKVEKRVALFRQGAPLPPLEEKIVVVVDDGLASGFTLLTAVEALQKLRPRSLVVAIPTGHEPSLRRVAREVDAVVCPNIRSGLSFAVASAYRHWFDVAEAEAVDLFRQAAGETGRTG